MRKVKKENVIEIIEDVKIGKGIILEKGDKIKILTESRNVWSIADVDSCEDDEIAFENVNDKYFTLYFTKVEYNSTKPKSMQVNPEGGYYFTFGNRSEPSKIFIKWATRNDLTMRAKFVFEDLENNEVKMMDLYEILSWLNETQALVRMQEK